MVSFQNEFSQLFQSSAPIAQRGNTLLCKVYQVFRPSSTFLNAQQCRIRQLTPRVILSDGFPYCLRIASSVQQIIRNLERQPNRFSIFFENRDCVAVGPADSRAQSERAGQKSTRLAAVNRLQVLQRAFVLVLGFQIDDLAADHSD